MAFKVQASGEAARPRRVTVVEFLVPKLASRPGSSTCCAFLVPVAVPVPVPPSLSHRPVVRGRRGRPPPCPAVSCGFGLSHCLSEMTTAKRDGVPKNVVAACFSVGGDELREQARPCRVHVKTSGLPCVRTGHIRPNLMTSREESLEALLIIVIIL